jgi:hypothetical protein
MTTAVTATTAPRLHPFLLRIEDPIPFFIDDFEEETICSALDEYSRRARRTTRRTTKRTARRTARRRRWLHWEQARTFRTTTTSEWVR